MYAPYVRDKVSYHYRQENFLNAEITYDGQTYRLPRGWWIVPAVISFSGVLGWLYTLPFA